LASIWRRPAPEPTDQLSRMTAKTAISRLETDHWIAMIVAIVVTISVWAALLFVLSGGMAKSR
jgi:hypothetical protein